MWAAPATPVGARVLSTHAKAAEHHPHGPTALVVGGNGALGQAMILAFRNAGWRTVCMDLKANPAAEVNITLAADKDWRSNTTMAEEKLLEIVRERTTKTRKHPVSTIVHCAGSWLGGGAGSLLSSLDPMLDINLKSACSAAYLASKFLDRESGAGMLLLTGAAAAANQTPTPGMLGYGMSKAATHQLATSLSQADSDLRGATVATLLPTMIDTPSNRAMSSNVTEYENWTPPVEFAALALAFAKQLQPPASSHGHPTGHKPVIEHAHAPLKQGGFYVFNTSKGKTSIKLMPPVVTAEAV